MPAHTTSEVAVTTTASDRMLRHEEDAFTAAAAADERMHDHAKKTFADWLLISLGLQHLQQRAMREAGTNTPYGPRYTKTYARLKEVHPWASHYDKTATSHCVWLAENIGPVTRWREALGDHQKKLWVTPRAVKERYQQAMRSVHTQKPADAPPTALQIMRDQLTKALEENDQLHALKNRVGPMFGNKSAVAAAQEIVDSGYNSDFMRRLGDACHQMADREKQWEHRKRSS
jgi:hypothetical protein